MNVGTLYLYPFFCGFKKKDKTPRRQYSPGGKRRVLHVPESYFLLAQVPLTHTKLQKTLSIHFHKVRVETIPHTSRFH
jgi:hypothetical protein